MGRDQGSARIDIMLAPSPSQLLQPLLQPGRLLRGYTRRTLRADLIAGATVGLVLLPQSLAFALLAGLPPEMGLYAAIAATIAGALWGSSSHLNTGPTNTASILALSVLLPLVAPGTPEFIAAAGLIAVLSGVIRLAMGLARLGMLVNFVSDSVAVGFTAGAGILIMSNQIEPMLRLDLPPTTDLIATLVGVIQQIEQTHLPSLLIGAATILVIQFLPRLTRKVPAVLAGIAGMALIAWLLGLDQRGVEVLGELPQGMPPLAALPLLDLELIGQLANGALALAIIGLVEAMAIARALAGYSGQRLDSNQEFVGQGMANIAAGVFSGYPCSGSFNRSALSYRSGGQTALANAFAGLFIIGAMFALGPLMTHLPRPVLAGALAITAFSMIDLTSIRQIWRGARGESIIMLVTLGSTLLLPLQFAVLIGVLMSLGYYLLRTSMPQVQVVVPDAHFQRWEARPNATSCPQLVVVDILGDLYFGAVNHVEERIDRILAAGPQRFLMLRMQNVQHCDMSGIRALEHILRRVRQRGGELFLVRVREPVLRRMQATGFVEQLGVERILAEAGAVHHLFHHTLDPAVCIYECELRVFRECQNLPKRHLPALPAIIPLQPANTNTPTMEARALWEALRSDTAPLVVDVRERREFRQGHVPAARNLPLSDLLAHPLTLPRDRVIVLADRSGRRSVRAATFLAGQGYSMLYMLDGGMLAWEAANLLTAVE
jgi:SulP family sulfate permease